MDWEYFAEIWKYNNELLKYFSTPVIKNKNSVVNPITIKMSNGKGDLYFSKYYNDPNKQWSRNYILIRSIVNDCACLISMINEQLATVKPDNETLESFKEKIDKEIFVIGLFLGIQLQEFKEKDLTDQKHIEMSLAQKFKNALAHANFNWDANSISTTSDPIREFKIIRYENGEYGVTPSGINIKIDNDHIEGSISLDRLMEITLAYHSLYLQKYKDKYGLAEFSSYEEFKKNIYPTLSEEVQKFISDYLNKYIGMDKWNNIEEEEKILILDILLNYKSKKVLEPGLCLYKTYCIDLGIIDIDWLNDQPFNSSLKPIFYINQLLSSAFFVFDYARELNHSNAPTKDTFDYFDINILGIDPTFSNGKNDKLFTTKNTKQEYIDLRKKIKKLYKDEYLPKFKSIINNNAIGRDTPTLDIDIMNNIIAGIIQQIILDNPDISKEKLIKLIEKMLTRYNIQDLTDEEKQMRNIIQSTIAKISKDIEMIDMVMGEEIAFLNEKCNENYEMKNYSNLARHLRNALSHGYYDIDFSTLSDKINLNQLKITLYDYDEGETKPSFCVTMTTGKMIKLINSFANHIDQQLTKGSYEARTERRSKK